MAKIYCEKCKKWMQEVNFYTYKNGKKTQLCKSCLTMHIDNFNPDTYLWILEKMDVPYIPAEWNIIRDKAYAKDPRKINGMTVLGKYLAKMRLKQFKDFGWADSERLQQERAASDAAAEEIRKEQEERVKQQFENGEITQAQYRTLVDTDFQKRHQYIMDPSDSAIDLVNVDPIGEDNMFNEKDFISQQDLPDLGAELTQEDKQFLAMKWGRTYKASEWVQLQKKYTEMMNSFDIQDADSINTLIFICKTYLKMNQAIDMGDVQGYQKLSRVYNDLRKTAKFTAAQNKQQKSEFIDSVGQLVAYCQKNGGQIPRYEIKTPYDIVDKIITDLKDYTKSLVYEDTALARQVQDYIKEARAILSSRKDLEEAKEKGFDTVELSDEDIIDFKEFLQKEKESAQKEMEGETENESKDIT